MSYLDFLTCIWPLSSLHNIVWKDQYNRFPILSISVCNKSLFEFIMAVASNSVNVSTAGGAGWLVLAGFDLPLVLVLVRGIL